MRSAAAGRIRYTPGLIRLAVLLSLGLCYFHSQKAFVQHRSLTLTFPILDRASLQADDLLWHPEIPERKWSDHHCNGGVYGSAPVLAQFASLVREFPRTTDTINGIRLHLGPRTKYGTVIQAIGSCRRDSLETYWLDDNELVVFNYPPQKPEPDTIAGLYICGAALLEREFGSDQIISEITWWESFHERYLKRYQNPSVALWPSLPLFALLLGISLYGATHTQRQRDSGSSPE